MPDASGYLTPEDEGAFKDMELKQKAPEYHPELTEPCPKCKGYGGWNLRLDAYGPGNHFQAFCTSCWGWGYLEPGGCAHEWEGGWGKNPPQRLGRCENPWTCKKCGVTKIVDSSD